MSQKNLKLNFQRELLFQIILNVKQKRLTIKYAQKIAQMIVPLLKQELEDKDFIEKISTLSQRVIEIREATIKTLIEYEKIIKQERLNLADFYLAKGDLDNALFSIKGGRI